MLHKQTKEESAKTTLSNVTKEMAKPRLARSARIAELKLDTTRIPEPPSTTMPGTVDRIIPPSQPSKPEKVQIVVDTADRKYRDLRIENTLTDEHGDDVKLKKGAHVDVTVAAEEPSPAGEGLHDLRQGSQTVESTQTPMEKKVQVFAVLRIDPGIRLLEEAVTVREILPTSDEAKGEVDRLGKLSGTTGARYFWQLTRYWPEGK